MEAIQSQRGFTLIELMITVAIVSVLSGLAFYSVQGQRPWHRLNEATGTTASLIQSARSRAIRTAQVHKICIISANPGHMAVENRQGRVVVVSCRPGMVCSGSTNADHQLCDPDRATGVDPAKVCTDAASCALPPGGCLTCNWGLTDKLNGGAPLDLTLSDGLNGIPDTEVATFLDATGNDLAPQPAWIELAFDNQGATSSAFTGTDAGVDTTLISGGVRILQTELNQAKGILWTVGGTTLSKRCQDFNLQCNL